jgi:hypothetical protein
MVQVAAAPPPPAALKQQQLEHGDPDNGGGGGGGGEQDGEGEGGADGAPLPEGTFITASADNTIRFWNLNQVRVTQPGVSHSPARPPARPGNAH